MTHEQDEHEHDDRHGSGPIVVDMHRAVSGPGSEFTRADVVVTNVDHSGCSYEVRLFFNHPDADGSTPRDEASGYAGRFHVFGHGGCFGDVGHCDVPPPSIDPTDFRPPHQLTPMSTYVTVTAALRRLLLVGEDLESLGMVPLSLPPVRTDGRLAPDLFRYETVDLRTYLSPLDEPEG
jgi:tyrosinase